jgi:hypothetical protein
MADAQTELLEALAKHVGTPPLTQAEIDAILDLAGAAAHGTGDRTSAPLTTFLAGIAAAGAADRAATLDDMHDRTTALTGGQAR